MYGHSDNSVGHRPLWFGVLLIALLISVAAIWYWLAQTDGLLKLQVVQGGDSIHIAGVGDLVAPDEWRGTRQRLIPLFNESQVSEIVVIHSASGDSLNCTVFAGQEPWKRLLAQMRASGAKSVPSISEFPSESQVLLGPQGSAPLRVFYASEGRFVMIALKSSRPETPASVVNMLMTLIDFSAD